MQTDVIQITPAGDGMEAALLETEKAAAYRGLDRKQSLRLRLLTEEMLGMLKTIVGPVDLCYWVESEQHRFSMHLAADTLMNSALRKDLIGLSTSGTNAAATGFMGRLKEVFTRFCEQNDASPIAAEYGYTYVDTVGYDASMDMSPNALLSGWSLSAYKQAVEARREQEAAKWDELEKSITAKLADEIRIFIRGNTVELIIEKAF